MNWNRNVASSAIARSALAIILVTSMAACATGNSPMAPTASTSASVSASPEPADALSANGEVPVVLDPELLADFPISVSSETAYGRHIYASWPTFSRPGIDAAISGYFDKTISGFEANYPAPKTNTSATPELNIEWNLLASSPSAVEIMADGYEFTGASGVDFWHTMWLDPATDKVIANSSLVNVAAANAALQAAAASRKAEIPQLDLAQVGASPYEAATLVAFAPTGELIIGYDECQIASCDESRITFTFSTATTESLLSAVGRRAQAATMSPGSAASSPKPSKSSTPTPATPSASVSKSATAKPTGSKVNCRKVKCVALTFDDGPGPYTTKLLGYLKAKQARATFFMLGQQVDTYPRVAKAVAKAGHEIGVHTWDHRSLSKLSAAQIDSELKSTIDIIRDDTGTTPTLLRPPYGAMNTLVRTEAKKYGLAVILWNVDTLDWKTRSTPKTVAAALKDTRRGSIILVHDIHKTTVAAVPDIIDGLRAKGYTFVTVTELIGDPKPGQKYFRG